MAELPFLAGEQGRGPFLVLLFFIAVSVVTVWEAWEGTLPATEEAVVAEIAREVQAGGKIWPLTLGGGEVRDLSPVAPWSMALFFRYFGANILSARLPFMIFSILTLLMTYIAGMRLAGNSRGGKWIDSSHATGLLAAVILSLSAFFGKNAGNISQNVPFTFFFITALAGWLGLPEKRSGLFLWGAGIAGSVMSAGSGGLLLIPGCLLASLLDARRGALWRDGGFIAATISAAVAAAAWLAWISSGLTAGTASSRTWAMLYCFASPYGNPFTSLVFSVRKVWIYTLPWSVPATFMVKRAVFPPWRRSVGAVGEVRGILSFALIIFAAAALARPFHSGVFLPVAAIMAIIAARGISIWMKDANMVWTLNQALISLICLLMLLLAATPLRIHRRRIEPVEDLARMAGKIVPEGNRLGSFRYGNEAVSAQLLFYGGRALGARLEDPSDVEKTASLDPGLIILTTTGHFEALKESKLRYRLNILYRVSDLLLINLNEDDENI